MNELIHSAYKDYIENNLERKMYSDFPYVFIIQGEQMRKNSITFKLFIVTTTFFILFLITVATSQSLFFEKFYIQQKIKNIEKNLEEFAQKYDKEDWDQIAITKNISSFINKNNAQIAILNDKAAAKHLPLFNIIIETSDKNKVIVPLNSMELVEGIKVLNLTIGSMIEIEGIYSNNEYNVLYPYSIEGRGVSWEVIKPATVSVKAGNIIEAQSAIKTYETQLPPEGEISATKRMANSYVIAINELGPGQGVIRVDMQSIKGKIVELNYPQQKEFTMPYREDMLWSAIDHWFWISKSKEFEINTNTIIRYNYKSPVNGIDNIIMIKPIFKAGRLQEMIFTMSSLQPVGEAIGVMKDYYIYGFLFAIIIILLLSYIYSRLIANPLIKINNVALRMAELDFTVECDVRTDDEIGNLATSINVLASNLHQNMKTLQGTNERLKVEIEKERNLERMRKEFVSSVSHELKTPLGIMRGFTEGLKDEIAIEKKDYYIDVILEEIENMDALVLDMLDLSRLESKAYILLEESFYIDTLVQIIESRFIQQLEDKDVKVLHKYSTEKIMVKADKKRIEQVLINIISNAIRHVKSGGFIEIIIKKDNNKLYISIENEGDTIYEDKIKHIWDRFYRVEESRDRKSGGTGLGLSIVKNILELHNSNYGVKNTDKGVMFYFTLKEAKLDD